jgi:thymidylate synthase (FAD)
MRYSNAQEIEEIELRKQAEKNRQSSTESFDPILDNVVLGEHGSEGGIKASDAISTFLESSMKLYAELLRAGVAREVARDILPLATETRMYMKGSVRSWIHYLELRMKSDTQKEHREIAESIYSIFKEKFPIIHRSLSKD